MFVEGKLLYGSLITEYFVKELARVNSKLYLEIDAPGKNAGDKHSSLFWRISNEDERKGFLPKQLFVGITLDKASPTLNEDLKINSIWIGICDICS